MPQTLGLQLYFYFCSEFN